MPLLALQISMRSFCHNLPDIIVFYRPPYDTVVFFLPKASTFCLNHTTSGQAPAVVENPVHAYPGSTYSVVR